MLEDMRERLPLGGIAEPDDVASLDSFLASGKASYHDECGGADGRRPDSGNLR